MSRNNYHPLNETKIFQNDGGHYKAEEPIKKTLENGRITQRYIAHKPTVWSSHKAHDKC